MGLEGGSHQGLATAAQLNEATWQRALAAAPALALATFERRGTPLTFAPDRCGSRAAVGVAGDVARQQKRPRLTPPPSPPRPAAT